LTKCHIDNCSLIRFSDDLYHNEYPPIPGLTKVNVNVNISTIDNIDENSMAFSMKLLLFMKWYDSRLQG
jgi:hypothetical protein